MEDLAVLTGMFGLIMFFVGTICVIVFWVMASHIGTIKDRAKRTNTLLERQFEELVQIRKLMDAQIIGINPYKKVTT